MGYAVDYPNAEFHEIMPRLYLGGHVWKDGVQYCDGRDSAVSEGDWDYVVSAYMEPEHEKSFPKCDARFVIFKDTESGLSDETWERIKSVVRSAADRWNSGEKVLIRCQAGFNRSGMIMALVLMDLGFTAEGAIATVRDRRSPYVLVNPVFEKYVREREGGW